MTYECMEFTFEPMRCKNVDDMLVSSINIRVSTVHDISQCPEAL